MNVNAGRVTAGICIRSPLCQATLSGVDINILADNDVSFIGQTCILSMWLCGLRSRSRTLLIRTLVLSVNIGFRYDLPWGGLPQMFGAKTYSVIYGWNYNLGQLMIVRSSDINRRRPDYLKSFWNFFTLFCVSQILHTIGTTINIQDLLRCYSSHYNMEVTRVCIRMERTESWWRHGRGLKGR